MKAVLAWVKTNLVSVICVVVALVLLPAGFVGSNIWGSGMREERQGEASSALSSLNNVKDARYEIPLPMGDEPTMNESAPPNPRRTERYLEIKTEVEAATARVIEEVRTRNAKSYGPLIEGLFPDPVSKLRGDQLALAFVDELVGERGGAGAYAALLDAINAGPGADNDDVLLRLQDSYETRLERIEAQMGRAPTPEELYEIRAELADERLSLYRYPAQRRSFFATPANLLAEAPRGTDASGAPSPRGRGAGAGGSSGFNRWTSKPEPGPAEPPSVAECFAWQFDYWTVKDTLMAIASANDRDDGRRGVPSAAVKRLLSLRVTPLFDPSQATGSDSTGGDDGGRDDFGGGFDDGGGSAGPSGPPSATVYQPDPSVSITGRVGSKGNQLYDLRNIEVVAVVSSGRIDDIIQAIEAYNLITVLDWRIESVDPLAHLAGGYFYGDDHVVRLTLQLESLWLRDWTTPFMPAGVRTLLGVPEDVSVDAGGEEFN
ncbi:MAG: hypothetical protein AAGK04_09350 [Planctomycetota bacterium]